jgi:hypothetical protein
LLTSGTKGCPTPSNCHRRRSRALRMVFLMLSIEMKAHAGPIWTPSGTIRSWARRQTTSAAVAPEPRSAPCGLPPDRYPVGVAGFGFFAIAMTSIDRELSSSNIGPQRASRPVAGRPALRRTSDQPIASTDCQEERFLRRQRSGSALPESHSGNGPIGRSHTHAPSHQ